MDTELREYLGRVARLAWTEYCRKTGDKEPAHLMQWEELGEWDREADRCIAAAVSAALCARIAQMIETLPHFCNPAVIESPDDVLMDVAERVRRIATVDDVWLKRS